MAKTRRCKNCKRKNIVFVLVNTAAFCNWDCAIEFGKKKASEDKVKAVKKKDAKQKREFKQSDLKTRKEAAKKACHAYIRQRDNGLPCICCGRVINGAVHAGHFLESGNNPKIRYDEDNIHAQSGYCNTYKGGDSDDYQGRLRLKIGSERVDLLLSKKGGTVKRTAEDYIEIETYYKEKLKQLNNAWE
ncbi:MAG: recombination protein NinG [Planctomycetota bacterium]|jgi:hypothetical protein